MASDLGERLLEPELMDDPALDPDAHRAALRGLARLNLVSRSAAIVWRPIGRLWRAIGRQPLSVLDVATGGGDVLVRLARLAQRGGAALALHGCDVSPTALEHARAQARRAGVALDLFELDVLRNAPPRRYDVVMCSLFLHHLTPAQAVVVLRRMADAAQRLVVVNDLRRCRAGLVAAQVSVRLLTRSPVVRVDGPRSVRAAFTPGELAELAQRAGLHDARVNRRWPWRMALEWKRP